MYIPEFWVGVMVGLAAGWISLIGLVYGAARWQRKGNNRR